MKRLPPEMRDWYFPFDWALTKLWSLNLCVASLPVSTLDWHFDIPIWSKEKGMHFNLHPAEVIQHPGMYPRHDLRIDNTDLSYPIDLMFTVDRLAILDGVHRLAKYKREGIDNAQVRIIPRQMIPFIRV